MKAEVLFEAGEREEEKGASDQPGMGAVGTESTREEELNGGGKGHFGSGVLGPKVDGNNHWS